MNNPEINRGSLAAGVFFVLLGIVFLLEALEVWDISPEVLWPSLLIAAGGALLISSAWKQEPPKSPPEGLEL